MASMCFSLQHSGLQDYLFIADTSCTYIAKYLKVGKGQESEGVPVLRLEELALNVLTSVVGSLTLCKSREDM